MKQSSLSLSTNTVPNVRVGKEMVGVKKQIFLKISNLDFECCQ